MKNEKPRFTNLDRCYGLDLQRKDFVKWCGYTVGTFPPKPYPRFLFVNAYNIETGHHIENVDIEQDKFYNYLSNHNNCKFNSVIHDKIPINSSNELIRIFENRAHRRKCKACVEYTIYNGGHVYFCIEGIDYFSVKNKSFAGEWRISNDEKIRFITNSELRWVERNWCNLIYRNNISFWCKIQNSNEWQKVPAPWTLTNRFNL